MFYAIQNDALIVEKNGAIYGVLFNENSFCDYGVFKTLELDALKELEFAPFKEVYKEPYEEMLEEVNQDCAKELKNNFEKLSNTSLLVCPFEESTFFLYNGNYYAKANNWSTDILDDIDYIIENIKGLM